MASKKSTYQKLQRKYVRKTNSLFSSQDGNTLLTTLAKNGHNSYLRFNRYESSSMDMAWVKRIIDCIPALGDIVGNPKKTIQTLAEVVQVEKVKKIGVETVQHLSSHTQFIKTVDENGNVTPSKLLNIYNDDFYAIYENKFIATLIRHLLVFVEKRYEFIKNSATMSDVSVLYAKNHTVIENAEIDIETKVRYSHPADASVVERMRGFVKQIEDIRKYIKFYMHSEFMTILRREKDVRNPIIQTNIIRKNPKYHKCYLLWLYIERYRESGIESKVEESYAQLSEAEIKEINQVMCANFLLLKGDDSKRKSTRKLTVYKPKIMNTYDDLIYKPNYYDGPVKYIRVDDRYRAYTEALYDVNPHPTRAVAQYDIEKYRANKKLREKTKQIDALLARKETEKANYEKGEALADEREKNRDAYVDAVAEKEIREEAIIKVEKVRKEVINEGKKLQGKKIRIPKKKEQQVEVIEEKPVIVVQELDEKEPISILPEIIKEQPLKEQPKPIKKAVKPVKKKEPKLFQKTLDEVKPVIVPEPIKEQPKPLEPSKEDVKPARAKAPKKPIEKKPAQKAPSKKKASVKKAQPKAKVEPKKLVVEIKPEPIKPQLEIAEPVAKKPQPKMEHFKAIGSFRSKKKAK